MGWTVCVNEPKSHTVTRILLAVIKIIWQVIHISCFKIPNPRLKIIFDLKIQKEEEERVYDRPTVFVLSYHTI
jgi:hypothetical protein